MDRLKFMKLWKIIMAIGITLGILVAIFLFFALLAWSKGLLFVLFLAACIFYGVYQWLG